MDRGGLGCELGMGGDVVSCQGETSDLVEVPVDCWGGEHDGQMGFDRLAGVVKNWAGPQIGFGDAERLLGVAAR